MNKRCLHISCWGALITLFLLPSCKMDMTELCDDHTHTTNMQVTFDWQLSPEATAKGKRHGSVLLQSGQTWQRPHPL